MKPEQLGDLIRQINSKGSQRAALFCARPQGGTRAAGDAEGNPVDLEARTVQVAFASETEEVERWYGIEILDCGPESVDLSLLNNRAPVLDMHDWRQQVGVVDSASADPDRICRALLRYSRAQRGEEILQDMADGIRTKISVGYEVLEMRLERESKDGPDVYRITKWRPFEVSNVSVPADDAVGLGRSAAQPAQPEQPEAITPESDDDSARGAARSAAPVVGDSPATPKAPTAETREAIAMTEEEKQAAREAARKQGGADEAQRVSDILDVARQYNAPSEMVDTMLRDSTRTKHDLTAAILEARANEQGTRAESPEIGMSEREVQQFSFVNLFRAMAFPDNAEFRKRAGFELECAAAAAETFRGERQGTQMIPHDVLVAGRALDINHLRQRGFNARALTATLGDTGDALVGTTHLAASFIDLLRNRMLLTQLGATSLTGLSGNLAIPRQTGGASTYWLDPENSDITAEGLATFDQVGLTPKTLGAFTEISRQLLLQGSPDVENLVRMDLAKQIALGMDSAALYGTGANGQPKGLVNQTSINKTDFAAVLPTYLEVVDMETQVALDNADEASSAYAVGAGMRGHLKTTEKFTGTNGSPIWEPGNQVNGYTAATSNQVAAGDMFFGDWAQMIVGMWGGLDMQVNPYSLDKSGAVRVTAFQTCDTACRHAESFNHGKQHTP